MKKSFNHRAQKEVEFRRKHIDAIRTSARFMGIQALEAGSALSKKILGGRKPVYSVTGELIGYA